MNHPNQALYDLITQQVDFIFAEILEVIDQDRQQALIVDEKIKTIWMEFYDELMCLLDQKKVSTLQKRPYVEHSEKYFFTYREAYEQESKNPYSIKLRPKTQWIDPPQRQILTTEARLSLGQQHFHIARGLKQYWRSEQVNIHTQQQLWGNVYLSLIYCSGCSDLNQLTAIANTLIHKMQQSEFTGCSKLYHAEYKTILNPLVLHYRMQHRYYGNQIDENKVYQWRHIWFNPYAQLFMAGIQKQELNHIQEQNPRRVLEAIIAVFEYLQLQLHVTDQLQALYKIRGYSDQKLLDMGLLKPFEHVNLGLEIHPDLSLDMCLSEVLQNRLKTVSLMPQDQNVAWFSHRLPTQDHTTITVSENIPLQTEHVKEQLISAHQQLKEIPFELMLFERDSEKASKNHKRQRKSEQIKLMRWKRIQESLQKKQVLENGKEKNLIEAQLRLLAWIFDLKAKNNKVSSIERYLSSIAKDYLFYVYMYEDDLAGMRTEDYATLYDNILNSIDDRDEIQRTDKPNSSHARAQYAFGRLKAFHHFCMQHYATPEVELFKHNRFYRVQLCHAKLISPDLFNQLKQRFMEKMSNCSTLKEQEYIQQLQLMYILAYRLGLRLNEIRGLTFAEIICPELIARNRDNQTKQIRIILKNNVYRRLKSQNAKRQLDLNAVLLKDEMIYVQRYLEQRFQEMHSSQTIDQQLVFSIGGEILSELYITQMTQTCFDDILGSGHAYTFHSFRHSAANHLAIAWLGSKEMIMTYTDYTWKQAQLMRNKLFGAQGILHERVIQHKWRLLADWMGHSSIEQTASHYLHVLDLLAIDRIYNTPCIVHPVLLKGLLTKQSKQGLEQINLNHEIAKNTDFEFYHQACAVQKPKYLPVVAQPVLQVSAYMMIRDYIERLDYQDHIWVQRASWLTAKLRYPKFNQLQWQQSSIEFSDEDALPIFYNEVRKRQFDLKILNALTVLEPLKKVKALVVLEIFIRHGKLRKNYLHFQYRFDQYQNVRTDWDITEFISGIEYFLPDYIKLKLDNYPIDLNQKSREIKLSFIHKEKTKNMTLCIVFALLLEAIQADCLWKIA